jgi:N-acetylmuramoyl-L-alanine amidase
MRTFAPTMKKRLLVLIGIVLLTVGCAAAAGKKFTLVIDAGHGGHDTGAVGAITKEKTINLNVALAFGRLVERNCPDVKVVYTRKTDVFIPLHTRADIANHNKADLFISIHTNSLPKGRISRGLETYTLGMHRAADNLDVAKRENSVILIEKDYKQRYQGFDPNSSESYIMFEFLQDHNMAQSVQLAKFVQQRACASAGRQNKGVKQAGFLVLRETSMPSCLIELGFISTSDEERFLHSSDGVDKLGRGIYQAFLDYKRIYDKNASVSSKAEVMEKAKVREKEKEKAETLAVAPAPEPKKEEVAKKLKQRKSKVAQELADIREGKVEETPDRDEQPVQVDADSILMAEATAQQPSDAPTTPTTPILPATPTSSSPASAPVFKLQILASATKLKPNDAQLKGQKDADYYQEGGLYKYTLGASENYNQIYQLRKAQLARFPQAFIVAFKDGNKMNVQEAIREFKNKKNK